MKPTSTVSKILAPVLTLMGLLSEFSQGAVLITFDEVGSNVVAISSGTFIIPTSYAGTFLVNSHAGHNGALVWLNGRVDLYLGGVSVASGLQIGPTSGAGSNFGYIGSQFYAPDTQAQGSIYTPVTTWTWDSTNIAALFPSGLNSTPTLVYTASNGETISFAKAVPEPSAMFILVVSAGFVSTIRRRK